MSIEIPSKPLVSLAYSQTVMTNSTPVLPAGGQVRFSALFHVLHAPGKKRAAARLTSRLLYYASRLPWYFFLRHFCQGHCMTRRGAAGAAGAEFCMTPNTEISRSIKAFLSS